MSAFWGISWYRQKMNQDDPTMQVVDARIMPATTLAVVQDAAAKGKDLIRLGRMYAVQPKK